MYDELIKRLHERIAVTFAGSPLQDDLREAAEAIEELRREVEEYKAAYRKEHDKRIAETRYLYDELTKAVKEKLLMTPMQIEAPEPLKEESNGV